MKRSLGSSDSLGAFMSMCPASEGYSPGSNDMYNSREYQSMLDGLDEEAGGHVSEKKRRLSVDQVKALEKNFEKENKLEPERKVKLAQELGLQPRQVAVWFQNRRARWKTKQLEKDYGVLRSNFDALKHNYESLKHDKESLLNEIKELRSKLTGENKSTERDLSLSVLKEEEGLLSECHDNNNNNKSMEANTINDGGSEIAKCSDSDSSAILNDDQSPNGSNSSSAGLVQNQQILTSLSTPPNSSTFRLFNSCSSDTGSEELGATQNKNAYHQYHHPQFVKMEEHNFFGGEEACNFFSVEQAPTLHWYCPDQW